MFVLTASASGRPPGMNTLVASSSAASALSRPADALVLSGTPLFHLCRYAVPRRPLRCLTSRRLLGRSGKNDAVASLDRDAFSAACRRS
jgi:hypothetical protein